MQLKHFVLLPTIQGRELVFIFEAATLDIFTFEFFPSYEFYEQVPLPNLITPQYLHLRKDLTPDAVYIHVSNIVGKDRKIKITNVQSVGSQ